MSDGAVTAEYLRNFTYEKPRLGKRGYNEKAVLLDDIATANASLDDADR